jgi:HEAT repeat protein
MKSMAKFRQALERRRWLAISITIVAGLLIGLGCRLWQQKRPYRERSVRRLLADLQKKDNALDLLHQKVWPILPSSLQHAMGSFAPTPAVFVRQDAASELRVREPKPTNALPVLRRLLRGPDIAMREAALVIVQGFGTVAQPLAADVRTLVENQAGGTTLRSQAILTLGRIAEEDPATVASLIAVLNEPTTTSLGAGAPGLWNTLFARHTAASVLGGLARPGNGVVPALITALKDSDPGFTGAVVEALGRVGPEDPEVVPAVIAAFERGLKSLGASRSEVARPRQPFRNVPPPEFEWRMFCSQSLAALEKLARPDNGVIPALLAGLKDSEAGFDTEILNALGRIGAITPEVVPGIVNVMEQSAIPAAFEALGRIGPSASPAVPHLLRLLQPLAEQPQPEEPAAVSPSPQLPNLAPSSASASWHMEFRARMQRRALLARFSLPLETLGRIGPAAREALPLLERIIQVQTNLWRHEALMARWQIDRDTQSALPGLLEGMPQLDREMRLRVVRFFQQMGIAGLTGLIAALRDTDHEVRNNAVRALGDLGPAALESVPHLEPLLEDPKNSVRFAAETALKRIQPAEAAKWKAQFPSSPRLSGATPRNAGGQSPNDR